MLLAGATKVSGGVLWANLNRLFWLSLVPFATGWMGENHFARPALVLYGGVLLMAGLSHWTLQSRLIAVEGPDSVLARAVGRDFKGRSSPRSTARASRPASGTRGWRGAPAWPRR